MSWRILFPSLADARRYLATIPGAARREATAAALGVDAAGEGRGETSPPAAPVLDALILPSGLVADPRVISSPPNTTITLTLPYPPSTNRIWRGTVVWVQGRPRVRILLSRAGRVYRSAVLAAIREAGRPVAPKRARLTVHLVVCVPDRRKRDIDNALKAGIDALTAAGVWADDSLIDELHVWRGPVVRGGRLLVTIAPRLEVHS